MHMRTGCIHHIPISYTSCIYYIYIYYIILYGRKGAAAARSIINFNEMLNDRDRIYACDRICCVYVRRCIRII
jgi:hypothetical protein